MTRLVFDLKRDANANVLLNNLYKHTPMQTSFAVNTVALVDGVPRTLTLRDALVHYVAHQQEVIRRRSEHRLRKARARAHIVEGLLKAIDMIDAIIAAIRASDDKAAARTVLIAAPFEFSEEQAEHILDMPLSRLTRLGRSNLDEELAQLRETMAELEAILGDDAVLNGVVKDEMSAIRDEFATERRTPIEFDLGDLDIEDLIDDEELVVMMTAQRLHQVGLRRLVPHAGTRRPRRGRGAVEGRGLRHRPHPHDRPLVPAVLLEPRSRLPPQGAPHPRGRADRSGTGAGEPAPAPARRADRHRDRHPRLRDPPVPVLRDQGRRGEEDAVQRLRLAAAGRAHRGEPP